MITTTEKKLSEVYCNGYITLAMPVTDIRHLYGKKPTISEALGLDRKDIEVVLYGDSYMVVSTESEDYPIGTALTLEQYGEAMDDGADIEIQHGAKALVTIAEAKGIDLGNAIVQRIKAPDLDTEHRRSCSIDHLIFKAMEASDRLRQMMKEKTPDIIIKGAYQRLQRLVDAYIDNGLRGTYLSPFGEPYDSVTSLELCHLTAVFGGERKDWRYSLFDGVDITRLREICEDLAAAHEDIDNIDIDNTDEDEYDEICEERGAEIEELHKEAEELVRNTLQKIAKERYPHFADSHTEIIEAGLTSLLHAVEGYRFFFTWLSWRNGLTNKKLRKVLFCGVIPNMDLTVRHIRQKLMWEE